MAALTPDIAGMGYRIGKGAKANVNVIFRAVFAKPFSLQFVRSRADDSGQVHCRFFLASELL